MADPVTTLQAAADTVNILSVFIDAVTNFFPKLIAFASILAAVTPPPDPASKWYSLLKPIDAIINHIAFNVRHAKNREER